MDKQYIHKFCIIYYVTLYYQLLVVRRNIYNFRVYKKSISNVYYYYF